MDIDMVFTRVHVLLSTRLDWFPECKNVRPPLVVPLDPGAHDQPFHKALAIPHLNQSIDINKYDYAHRTSKSTMRLMWQINKYRTTKRLIPQVKTTAPVHTRKLLSCIWAGTKINGWLEYFPPFSVESLFGKTLRAKIIWSFYSSPQCCIYIWTLFF